MIWTLNDRHNEEPLSEARIRTLDWYTICPDVLVLLLMLFLAMDPSTAQHLDHSGQWMGLSESKVRHSNGGHLGDVGTQTSGGSGEKEDDEALSTRAHRRRSCRPRGETHVHSSSTVLYIHLESRSSHRIHLTYRYYKCQLILYLLD